MTLIYQEDPRDIKKALVISRRPSLNQEDPHCIKKTLTISATTDDKPIGMS